MEISDNEAGRHELAVRFFSRTLGNDWEQTAVPKALSGRDVVETLWALNDRLRKRSSDLHGVKYLAASEPELDSAIEKLAATEDLSALDNLSAGALRVLDERHRQMVKVAIANEFADNDVIITLPAGLSADQQLVAVILLRFWRMVLPWPPGGPRTGEGVGGSMD